MGVVKEQDNKDVYCQSEKSNAGGMVIPTELDDTELKTTSRKRIPKKSTRAPCPMTFMKRSGRKAPGSKNSRRYENTCFLLDLVDNDEVNEITAQDFLNSNQTAFELLFAEQENMKIWNDFINRTEEDQDAYLKNLEEKKVEIKKNCEPVMDDTDARIEHPAFDADECYKRISSRFRNMLRRRHPPKGTLEHLEGELVCWFSDDPCSVYISCIGNSFERLLLHALSQYLDLQSSSFNQGSKRHTKVENDKEYFSPPRIPLSQYLDTHCKT
ncbi:R3H domain-containing protein 4-like [Antedon mediterranea]|uniref:R3H domain-containing protein 4-like n=1 Tax=Antedon mediterranea TaxID=105859 RepID=UPI003AF9DA4D